MNKIGKRILGLSIITALLTILIFSASYFYIYIKVYSNLQSISRETVEEAVKIIDGDKLQAVISENSMDTESYKEIYDAMILYKADKNVRYLYTFRILDDSNVAYVVDASVEDKCEIGETYTLDDDMKMAFKGEVVSSNKAITDEFGTFLSAYAPIKDSKGNVIAIVGADQDVGIYGNIGKFIINITIFALLAVLFISLMLSLRFSKKLNSSIGLIEDNLSKMAEGDLTNPVIVNSNDEISTIAKEIDEVRKNNSMLLSKVKDNSRLLLDGVNDLSSVSKEMTASSTQVTGVVKILSLSAFSQAERLVQISNNLLKFGDDVGSILRLSEDANTKVKNIDQMAQSGNGELQSLIKQLSDIKEVFKGLSDKIIVLSNQIEKISDITDMINGIADQTNLLALNAAIESARAGEAGKGFSVVADEIRKLSEKSKDSSGQINQLIINISANSKEATLTTEQVSDRLNSQINIIEDSLMSFRTIIESIDEITPKVAFIKDSAKNIDLEKDSILSKVQELAKSAEETSKSAETISSSMEIVNDASNKVSNTAEELREMAKNMLGKADRFKL